MKYIVACDSFKGSLTSQQANTLVKESIQEVDPRSEVKTFQLSDGGEGFLETVKAYILGGTMKNTEVHDAHGQKIIANYYMYETTAYIESAEAIGIEKIPVELLDIKKATSFGLGELILDAYQSGAKHFVIGLGGSATSDLGLGVLQALGCQLYDEKKELLPIWQNNQFFTRTMTKSTMLEQLRTCHFTIISDVEGELTGPSGAALMFAKQKGASKEETAYLEKKAQYIMQLYVENGGIDAQKMSGSASAGGLGCLFQSFFQASITLGSHWFIEVSKIIEVMEKDAILITGEGSVDAQTLEGKGPGVIAERAKQEGMKTIALGGKVEIIDHDKNIFDAIFSIQTQPRLLSEAMDQTVTKNQLIFTVRQIIQLLKH